MTLTYQPARHLATAVEGCAQGLLVNQAHIHQVLLGLDPAAGVIIARSTQPNQRALPSTAQFGMMRLNEQAPARRRIQPTFFLANPTPFSAARSLHTAAL